MGIRGRFLRVLGLLLGRMLDRQSNLCGML